MRVSTAIHNQNTRRHFHLRAFSFIHLRFITSVIYPPARVSATGEFIQLHAGTAQFIQVSQTSDVQDGACRHLDSRALSFIHLLFIQVSFHANQQQAFQTSSYNCTRAQFTQVLQTSCKMVHALYPALTKAKTGTGTVLQAFNCSGLAVVRKKAQVTRALGMTRGGR